MNNKDKQLAKFIAVMFFSIIVKLSFLYAGCYLLLKNYIGCGITCLIFAFVSGFSYHYSDDEKDKENKDESK